MPQILWGVLLETLKELAFQLSSMGAWLSVDERDVYEFLKFELASQDIGFQKQKLKIVKWAFKNHLDLTTPKEKTKYFWDLLRKITLFGFQRR